MFKIGQYGLGYNLIKVFISHKERKTLADLLNYQIYVLLIAILYDGYN